MKSMKMQATQWAHFHLKRAQRQWSQNKLQSSLFLGFQAQEKARVVNQQHFKNEFH